VGSATVTRDIFTVAPPYAEESTPAMCAPDGCRAVHQELIDSTGLADVEASERQQLRKLAIEPNSWFTQARGA
jgi:hypothetical protein